MGPDTVADLIVAYRYWILVPLAFIEGPIVAFIAGTLASLGYFSVYGLGVFFLARDLIMDGLYYALGYYGERTAFVRRLLRKIGVDQEHLENMRELWEQHAGKTMFIGKLSYGIASGFIAVAGLVRMPLKKFFAWGIIVAVVEWGGLLALGYFFGVSIGANGARLVENAGYVIGGIALFASLYYAIGFYLRQRWRRL